VLLALVSLFCLISANTWLSKIGFEVQLS